MTVGSGLGRACAREEAAEARKQGVLGAAPEALALCEGSVTPALL